MRNLLDRILRAPEGGGDIGAAAPAAGADAAAAAAPPAPAGGADAAAAPPPPAAGLDAPPSVYRPEGIPDDWVGETEKDTIDRLAKVAKGYRDRDSKGGVPEDVAEYRQFETIDDALKPYYETLEGDGMFDDIAAVAKEHGISKPAFQALLGKYMASAAEMGILEPPVDKSVERAALLPEGAMDLPKAAQDAAIEKRMNENLGWLAQMKERGLGEDSADYVTMMLGDSAKGHKALEFFRAQMTGADAPRPGGAGDGANKSNPAADLSRRSGLPENTPGSATFNKASYDQLQADYQRVHGD